MQFFAYNLSGKHFNPTSCGVIRNQRSKIRRSNITSTAGCPFRKISKFECRVIKHARNKLALQTKSNLVRKISLLAHTLGLKAGQARTARDDKVYFIQNPTITQILAKLLRHFPNPKLRKIRPILLYGRVLYTRYPIVARRAWPTGCSAFRPSASREQRYLVYKAVSCEQISFVDNLSCQNYFKPTS